MNTKEILRLLSESALDTESIDTLFKANDVETLANAADCLIGLGFTVYELRHFDCDVSSEDFTLDSDNGDIYRFISDDVIDAVLTEFLKDSSFSTCDVTYDHVVIDWYKTRKKWLESNDYGKAFGLCDRTSKKVELLEYDFHVFRVG